MIRSTLRAVPADTMKNAPLPMVLAAVLASQGCISYTVAGDEDRFTGKRLTIAAAIGAGELGVGALLGYAVYKDPEGSDERLSLGANIAAVTAGIVVFDLIIAGALLGTED
jgi:hypothetical protein